VSLLDTISGDLHEAIKAKNEDVVRTLRMLKSDIMYEKTKGTAELTDEAVLEVVARASKKRKEAIEEFTKAGRGELAAKEAAELEILARYLPEQLGEEAIAAAIDRKIEEMGAVTAKDFGKIMSVIMKELKGRADGAIVKSLLGKKLEGR